MYFTSILDASRMQQDEQRSNLQEEFVEGLDYYINEAGRWVFTAHYLLKRGYCCKNGCTHCPYGYSPDI